MNKKGFTLIELLAVIVILAIIALIATPIVLNIIKDTKDSSQLHSSEFYLDAVSNSILRKQMNNVEPFTPTECQILNDGNLICDGNVKVEVDVDGDKPTSGKIQFENGSISKVEMELGGKTIIKNEEGKLVYQTGEKENKLNDICTYDPSSTVPEKTAGAKYNCKVDPNEDEYTFLVLKTPKDTDTSINLISDSNINRSGFQLKTELIPTSTLLKYCIISWNSSGTNASGPVTVMDFLYNATKNWTNVPDIIMDYTDEGNQYGKIVTTSDRITRITMKDDSPVTVLTDQEGYSHLKARLPYQNEITGIAMDRSNIYLFNYLTNGGFQTNEVLNLNGYWTLASSFGGTTQAIGIDYTGQAPHAVVNGSSGYGVRPVITLGL